MAQWTHSKTAYILRWNKPDYKAIIGVFGTEKAVWEFAADHNFTPDDILSGSIVIEEGRYYDRLA